MLQGRRIIAVMLVVALLAAAAAAPMVVLPDGEELDDAALEDVKGKAGPAAAVVSVAVRAAAAWVGVKLAESAWNNVIEPALDKYVWSPVRDRLGL